MRSRASRRSPRTWPARCGRRSASSSSRDEGRGDGRHRPAGDRAGPGARAARCGVRDALRSGRRGREGAREDVPAAHRGEGRADRGAEGRAARRGGAPVDASGDHARLSHEQAALDHAEPRRARGGVRARARHGLLPAGRRDAAAGAAARGSADLPRRRGRHRHLLDRRAGDMMGRTVRGAGWVLLVLGVLGAAALLVLRQVTVIHTWHEYLIAAASFIPLLWVPLLVACVSLTLVLRRRWRLIGAALTLVLAAVTAWPMLPAPERSDTPQVAPEGTLTVLSSNIEYGGADIDEITRLAEQGVDAIALQEVTPEFEEAL